ncbi:hypothetical protein PHYPSEUDO_012980 [Phytophthora pseudosyringae]|uniref:RxLR effector protein n=1 Tax=Phytophthora pseudosyringae TaxID=221518 RepID=A0A8T1W680_9STRA|nr:hypothetical protein PHYPSEUDO_012980 [Phytophthora pseudosyringae]
MMRLGFIILFSVATFLTSTASAAPQPVKKTRVTITAGDSNEALDGRERQYRGLRRWFVERDGSESNASTGQEERGITDAVKQLSKSSSTKPDSVITKILNKVAKKVTPDYLKLPDPRTTKNARFYPFQLDG